MIRSNKPKRQKNTENIYRNDIIVGNYNSAQIGWHELSKVIEYIATNIAQIIFKKNTLTCLWSISFLTQTTAHRLIVFKLRRKINIYYHSNNVVYVFFRLARTIVKREKPFDFRAQQMSVCALVAYRQFILRVKLTISQIDIWSVNDLKVFEKEEEEEANNMNQSNTNTCYERLRNLYYKTYATKQIISTLILVWEQEKKAQGLIFFLSLVGSRHPLRFCKRFKIRLDHIRLDCVACTRAEKNRLQKLQLKTSRHRIYSRE